MVCALQMKIPMIITNAQLINAPKLVIGLRIVIIMPSMMIVLFVVLMSAVVSLDMME